MVAPKSQQFWECPDLANAFFYGKLHISNMTWALPEQSRRTTAVYTFALPSLPIAPDMDPVVEMVMEFAFFPGGLSGQMCRGTACTEKQLQSIGVEWSGREILDSRQARIRVPATWFGASGPTNTDARTCCSFANPRVSYDRQSKSLLFWTNEGARCSLGKIPQVTSLDGNVWLHLIGDSNARHLALSTAKVLGAGHCVSHTQHPQTNPTHYICWSTNERIVVTFSWFYAHPSLSLAESIRRSHFRSMGDYIKAAPFNFTSLPPPPRKALAIPQTHTFLLFGSHQPHTLYDGFFDDLTKAASSFTELFSPSSSLSIMLTTAANPSRIPSRFPYQALVRNNVHLKALNEVVRQFADQNQFRVIDLFAITRMAGDRMVDAVHFDEALYLELAKVLVADWSATGEQRCNAEKEV